jgi:hypothetical protein
MAQGRPVLVDLLEHGLGLLLRHAPAARPAGQYHITILYYDKTIITQYIYIYIYIIIQYNSISCYREGRSRRTSCGHRPSQRVIHRFYSFCGILFSFYGLCSLCSFYIVYNFYSFSVAGRAYRRRVGNSMNSMRILEYVYI